VFRGFDLRKKRKNFFSIFIWRLEIKTFIFALAFRLKKLSFENISIERYRTDTFFENIENKKLGKSTRK
jgi:hypothetical protein